MSLRAIGQRQGASMFRIALQAMALLIVLPSLIIVYLFKDHLSGEKVPALLGVLVVVGLGYYLLWRVLWGVKDLLTGLHKIASGEAESLKIDGEVSQLKEIGSLIDALNRLTSDFRENAVQLENLIQQFATVAEITEITASVPDITHLLGVVLRRAMASTHARIGSVGLLSEDRAGLNIVAYEGWTPQSSEPAPIEGSLAKIVADTGMPMLIEDIEKSPLTQRPNNAERYATNSFLIMPLRTRTATIGILSVADKVTGAPFHSQDQQFLSILLGNIGYAVENARLLEKALDAASNLRETVETQESQLRRTQINILQTEQLSPLGQLIEEVVGDLNSLLHAILGYASLPLMNSQNDPAVTRLFQQIQMTTDKASGITTQLLAFGRRQKQWPGKPDLNRVIKELMKLLLSVHQEYGRTAESGESSTATT